MKLSLAPLSRQVIVITGASSGIGLATARLAASRGAHVVLVARSRRALQTLQAEIEGKGGRALVVIADVSREDEVQRVADKVIAAFGGIDTWVNNAAVSAYGACLEVSIDDARRIMDTNFWGVVFGSRVACAHLRHRGGALINIGSVVSDRAAPLQGVYSASKHAIKGWTDALRAELMYANVPISVTLIKPAAIGTPYAEHARNYLEDQPSHVPPVYSARSVARAVLHAARHPVRELTVGGSGKVLAFANTAAPGLTETLMAKWLLPATHSGRAPHGRTNLFVPGEDLRERGEYRGLVRPSVYTAARLHPLASALIAVGAALCSTYIINSAGGAASNTRRSTLRAAQ